MTAYSVATGVAMLPAAVAAPNAIGMGAVAQLRHAAWESPVATAQQTPSQWLGELGIDRRLVECSRSDWRLEERQRPISAPWHSPAA
jgi:hypothetical protein